MSISIIILIVGLALSTGVGIGGGIGAASARKQEQQTCLERAALAGIRPSRAEQVCGRSNGAPGSVVRLRDRRAARRAARM